MNWMNVLIDAITIFASIFIVELLLRSANASKTQRILLTGLVIFLAITIIGLVRGT